VPIVHACAREDCEVLTMGDFCLEHERALEPRRKREHRPTLARVAQASALVAAGIVGASLRAHFGR
jgi:hypothetical protein